MKKLETGVTGQFVLSIHKGETDGWKSVNPAMLPMVDKKIEALNDSLISTFASPLV